MSTWSERTENPGDHCYPRLSRICQRRWRDKGVEERERERGMKGAEGLGYLRGRDTTQVPHCCVVIVVGIRVVGL